MDLNNLEMKHWKCRDFFGLSLCCRALLLVFLQCCAFKRNEISVFLHIVNGSRILFKRRKLIIFDENSPNFVDTPYSYGEKFWNFMETVLPRFHFWPHLRASQIYLVLTQVCLAFTHLDTRERCVSDERWRQTAHFRLPAKEMSYFRLPTRLSHSNSYYKE